MQPIVRSCQTLCKLRAYKWYLRQWYKVASTSIIGAGICELRSTPTAINDDNECRTQAFNISIKVCSGLLQQSRSSKRNLILLQALLSMVFIPLELSCMSLVRPQSLRVRSSGCADHDVGILAALNDYFIVLRVLKVTYSLTLAGLGRDLQKIWLRRVVPLSWSPFSFSCCSCYFISL